MKIYLLTYILSNDLFPNLLPFENIFIIITLQFISFFCLIPVQLIVLHVSMIFYFHLVNPCLVFVWCGLLDGISISSTKMMWILMSYAKNSLKLHYSNIFNQSHFYSNFDFCSVGNILTNLILHCAPIGFWLTSYHQHQLSP